MKIMHMKKLMTGFHFLPFVLFGQDTTAFKLYQSLSNEQEEVREIFLETLKAYQYGNASGRMVALDFVPFLETTIEKYKVVECHPEVLVMEMGGLETIRLLKENTDDTQDANQRMDDLLQDLSAKAREIRLECAEYLGEITSH